MLTLVFSARVSSRNPAAPTLPALNLGNQTGSSGTYNLNGGVLAIAGLSQGGGAAAFNFGGGTLEATGPFSTGLPMTLTGSGGNATVDANGYAVTFSGNLSGPGGLVETGSGELMLSGTDTYSGGTTVSGGTLDITAASALPSNGFVTIFGGGRLVLGSGAGIGSLLAASSPIGSEAVALNAAASAPPTISEYENTSGDLATVGSDPTLPAGGTAAVVPEPGAIVLLGVGAIGLLAYAWRRRGAKA